MTLKLATLEEPEPGTATETFAEPRSRGYSPAVAWSAVAILLLFSQLSIMDRQIVALLVEPIKRDLGLSDTQLGLLQGLAFAVMYCLAGLPIGWAVDRYPRRMIIYLGITIWSLSAASCGLARNFWQMFLGRAAVGVGEATVSPVALSLISDLFPPNKVGTPLGVFAAGYSLGNGVALVVGGLVIGLFAGQAAVAFPLIGTVAPWQAVFIVTGLPGIVIAFLAFFLREPPRPRHPPLGADGTQPAADGVRSFLAARGKLVAFSFAAFGLSSLAVYAIGGWTPAYLGRVFGWSAERIGATFGLVFGISGTLGSLMGGIMIDKVYGAGRHDASFLVPAVCTLVSIPFLISAFFMPTPQLALLCIGIGQFAFATLGPGSYATWQAIAPPHLRGRLTSAFLVVASIGGVGLGPVAVGFTTDHVFGDETMVGKSVATVLAIVLPSIVLLLFAGCASMRALSPGAEGNRSTGFQGAI
jgi:MFS family permease